MASDDPTIIQPPDSSDEPGFPNPIVRVSPASANDRTELTPNTGTPAHTDYDRTADQGEPDRLRASALSSVNTRTIYDRSMPPPGEETASPIEGYRPIRKLGEGTFGKVWLYEAVPSGKRVAVKFFPHGTTQHWHLLQAEIMQLARLFGDPGIVQLQDLEPEANPPYCVLTYAEGGSLADVLDKGPLPVDEALRIFTEAATALAYVHAKGIIHCDLKPGNVLLDARGKVLLADFGQAHLASDLSPSLGTFFYMAPEQADLSTTIPDTRWDVYALGALFYTMTTGKPPHDDPLLREQLGKTSGLAERLNRYREAVRKAPKPTALRRLHGMDRRLAQIVDQCLECDPARRFRSGGSVLEALNRRVSALRHRPVFLFGLLAPLLLLLIVAIVALGAGRGALRNAENALIQRQLEDDKVLANLGANLIAARLQYRIGMLERFAKEDVALRRALTLPPADRRQYQERLDALRKYLEEHRPASATNGWLFFQLLVADRDGCIVADDPPNPSLHRPRNWSWRAWFNGDDDKYDAKESHYPIGTALHVSQPYVFRGADPGAEGGDNLVIALSVPVKAAKGDEVVGRLVGLMKVSELHTQLEHIGMREKHGCFVVVNGKGTLIYHGLHNDRVAALLPRDGPPRLPGTDSFVLQPFDVNQAPDAGVGHFVDPLDGKECLAASADVANRDWRVIVESERDATLQPSGDLARWMRNVGLVALLVAGLLVLALYTLLRRTLRRAETRPHG